MLTNDWRSTYARVEAWGALAPPAPEPEGGLAPGAAVVAIASGRRGSITSLISPARAGRSVYVVWEGGRDLALLRPDEIALATPTPGKRTESVRFVVWTLPRA